MQKLPAMTRIRWPEPPFASGVYAVVDGATLGWTENAESADRLDSIVESAASYAYSALAGGAVAVQLRWKGEAIPAGFRLACARAMSKALGGVIPFIVNDDVEVATHAAAGLHLGQGDGDPLAVRSIVGPAAVLGWSTHRLSEVDAAATLPVSYLGFGPVRWTHSKSNTEPVTGWAALADACARSAQPVVAIGGLSRSDAAIARQAGAHAFAVIGAWLQADGQPLSPQQAQAAIHELAQAWAQAPR
ncbi:MAG: thiamine phosphate synthase [Myxococcales bacterium]|nr:thiamine phosphate synthase [Myxococcales bacterium]